MEKRFFIEKTDLVGGEIVLKDDEHMHLSKVLRLRVGDTVECFYDGGEILKCEITLITKNYSNLKVVDEVECSSNPVTNITLFQGLPKLDKLELISQKLTEIGITKIIPFSSTFCVAKENLNKIDRLKKIIVSACKQCGRTQLTKVENPIKFKQMLENLKEYDLVVFANETQKQFSLHQALSEVKSKLGKIKNVAFVVGSEGGFSVEEIESLISLDNVKSISLGPRILRTETASITLGSLLAYELGEI